MHGAVPGIVLHEPDRAGSRNEVLLQVFCHQLGWGFMVIAIGQLHDPAQLERMASFDGHHIQWV
jgi:hypothetical protein